MLPHDWKVAKSILRIAVVSSATIALLVGGITWANSVDNTAKQALQIGEENRAELRKQREEFSAELKAMRDQMARQDINMTELRVDMKYAISALNDLKGQRRP